MTHQDAALVPPETASPPKRKLQKRGRKTTAVADALRKVPSTPVDAELFATECGVSLASLRQVKRFTSAHPDGVVLRDSIKFKTDKATNKVFIWRVACD